MKTIPYTTSTGVKIGSRWNESPKPMPIDDPDMETIQTWFIHTPQWHKSRRMERTVAYIFTAIAALIALAMWIKV
jgi:hypothetical protein